MAFGLSAKAVRDAPEYDTPSEPGNTWTPIEPGPVTAVSEAVAVERVMWEGARLPEKLSCDCRNGRPHHRSGYSDMPITKAAREFPAGSTTFLETNFQQAFRPCLHDGGISYEVSHIDLRLAV